jgi:hypothetical protein
MIALTDTQMHELRQASAIVPRELRDRYLTEVAAMLAGKDLGDGSVRRVCRAIANRIIWDAGRRAIG